MNKRVASPWAIGLAVLAVVSGAFHFLGSSLSNGIYFATAVVVLWYTIETRNMRLEMVRQNEMAVRPLLVTAVEWVKEETVLWSRSRGTTTIPSSSELLLIHNVGRGPALSVHIEDLSDDRLRVSFNTIDVIPAATAERAQATVYADGRKADEGPAAFIASLKATSTQTYRLTVRYRDVAGRQHFSIVQMGKDGTRLLQHSGVEV